MTPVSTMSEPRTVPAIPTGRMPYIVGREPALAVLCAHAFLTCSFGQYFAKLKVGRIYTTDVLVITILALSLPAQVVRLRRAVVLGPVVGMLLLAGLWLVLGGVGDAAANLKSVSFYIYSGFFFAAVSLLRTEKDRWFVLFAICSGALVASFLGLHYAINGGGGAFSLGDQEIEWRVEVTTTQSIRWLSGEFAIYGICAITIVLARIWTRGTRRAMPWLVLGSAGLLNIVLAQHRSGFVALFGGVLGMALLMPRAARFLKRASKRLVGVSMVIAVVGYVFASDYLVSTVERIGQTTNVEDVNAAWRLLAWKEVGLGVLEKPLGHGFTEWSFFFNAHAPDSGSHNSYLDLAYRIGVPGLALLSWLLGAFFVLGKRVSRRFPDLRGTVVATAGATIAILYYAFFNVVFDTPYMSSLFWLILGVGVSAISEARQRQRSEERALESTRKMLGHVS